MVLKVDSAVHIWAFSHGILKMCPVPPNPSGFPVAVSFVLALCERSTQGPSANSLRQLQVPGAI